MLRRNRRVLTFNGGVHNEGRSHSGTVDEPGQNRIYETRCRRGAAIKPSADKWHEPRTLQKPSIRTPAETDPCFIGVFHTLNQRPAQLYY